MKEVPPLDAYYYSKDEEFWEAALEEGWDLMWLWRYMAMRFLNKENKEFLEENVESPWGPHTAWTVLIRHVFEWGDIESDLEKY